MLAATAAPAQTLARPGWNGSGFNADQWWKHAVFYNVATASTAAVDLKATTAKLDTLRAIGVDALILPQLPLPAQPSQPDAQQGAAASADAAVLDDFDELIHQASRDDIRVLLKLYVPNGSVDLSAAARFWLNRGVSGFHVVTAPTVNPQDAQTIMQAVRRTTNGAVGARIVISDMDPAAGPTVPLQPRLHARATTSYRRGTRHADAATPHLQIDSRLDRLPSLDAASIRAALAQSLMTPDLLLDFSSPFAVAPVYSGPGPDSPSSVATPNASLERVRAAILMATHSAALIDGNATAGAAAIEDWYRQLSILHHGNSTLRLGAVSVLDFDAQNALVWVFRPATITSLTPPIVVVCNLSGSASHLSLTAPLRALNLRGTFLRTLARTYDALGGEDLNAVNLPPYAVYIGELRR
jgi:alpha-glucosidase